MIRRLALVLLVLALVIGACRSWGAAGVLGWTRSGAVQSSVLVSSNSCADVRALIDAWEFRWGTLSRAYSCSSDPVIAGADVYGTLYTYHIASIAATATDALRPSWFSTWLAGTVAPAWYLAPTGGSGGDVAQVICVKASVTEAPCTTGFAPWSPVVDSTPFDYAHAAEIFGFFFSFTVGVWWVGKAIGSILGAVRKW